MVTRLALLAVPWASTALAQREEDVALATSRDVRGDTDDTLVLPARTLTGTPQVRFLTADGAPGERPLAFTDVLLWTPGCGRRRAGWPSCSPGAPSCPTRVCARLGVAATWVRDWDLFAELQVLDRGDLAVPGTTIPAMDGGFDQRVLMIGVTSRFELLRAAADPR